MGALYMLTFPSGKRYIGITRKSAEQRFAAHFYQRRNRPHRPLARAIEKYGRDSVIVETLATADWDVLPALEIEAIERFGTKYPGGYNLTDGGEVPTGLTADTRRRMGEKKRGKTYRLGMKHTPEARARMSAARIGRCFHTPETIEKLRESMTGNKYGAGVTHTAETRAKRIASLLRGGPKANSSGVKGVCFDARTNRYRAHITIAGKMLDLGRYPDLADAIAARTKAEREALGRLAA